MIGLEDRQALARDIHTAHSAGARLRLACETAGIDERTVGASGYPKTLELLASGVEDPKSPTKAKIYFLRRIPRDPMSSDPSIPAAETWGKRSYASSAENPQEGNDVFDIYSLSTERGLNGIPYQEW